MDIPPRALDGQRPIERRPHQVKKERPLSREFIMRELAGQICAAVVDELADFIGPETRAWPQCLERLEKRVERILVAEYLLGT